MDLLHQDAPRPGLPLPLFGLDRHHADEDEEEGDDDNDDDDDDDDIRATVNEEILSRYQRAMYGVENGLSRLQSFAQRMDGLADERAEERGALLSRHPHGSGSGAATWPLSETSDHHASHVSVYTGADGEQSSMDLSVATLRRVYGDMRRATQDHPSADDGSGSADGGAGRPQRASSRHGRGAHSLANERRSHRPRTRVRDGGAAHATSSAALGDDDSLLPYAVFHLAPRKSKVTIKFSPPV